MTAGTQAGEFEERRERLAAVWQQLPDKPDESVDAALRALWFAAAGAPRSVSRADGPLPALRGQELEVLDQLVARRAAGEPLAYIVGVQSFMGLELVATRAALIPRVETELLARTALDRLAAVTVGQTSSRVLDVCTGCGNVALAVAAHAPSAHVYGADLSEDAVELAKLNAKRLGLDSRVRFEAGDLFAPFDASEFHGTFDVVTCNPPYITSKKVDLMPREIAAHEPRMAFDGGSFGFDVITRAFTNAPRLLKPGGWFCFELGAGQGAFTADRVRRTKLYSAVEEIKDERGTTRVIAARAV
jgi:release factor glutamine methyltransferase